MLDYLFLEGNRMPKKSIRFFNTLYQTAVALGMRCHKSSTYQPCKALVVYGPGGPDRFPAVQEQIRLGRAALLFDIGYWDRAGYGRKYRFSLNDLHPLPKYILAGPTPSSKRYDQSGLPIRQNAATAAMKRVLLVGNAPKACAVGARGWTSKKASQIRVLMPEHSIAWRPKPGRPREARVDHDSVSIENIVKAVAGSTLVVCKHSNVAIDACIQGVPVVCENGAASAIYPSRLQDRELQPSFEQRKEFLHRLAYWQWSQYETNDFWGWFFRTFPEYDYR